MNDEVWLKLAKRVNEVLAVGRRRRHRDHARHRHDGGDRLLPEPRRQERQAGRRWSARCGRRPRSAPTVRATSTTPWPSRPIPRRAGGRAGLSQRQDPLRAQRHQDQHDQRGDVQEPEPRPRRRRQHGRDRVVRADGPQAGNATEFRSTNSSSCRASTSSTRTRTWMPS